jgi:uncharacterized protein with HEPN domain
MSERIDAYLLEDILESIQNIFQFTEGVDFEQFDSDLKTRHAVQHNFMIIGEASDRISEALKKANPGINWRDIKSFRNIIVHDYFGIDTHIVWEIIQNDLMELQNQIKQIGSTA